MPDFCACPSCGKREPGVIILRCRKCGALGCFKPGDKTTCYYDTCPACHSFGFSQRVGEVRHAEILISASENTLEVREDQKR